METSATAPVPSVQLVNGHSMPVIGLGTAGLRTGAATDEKAREMADDPNLPSVTAAVECAIEMGYRHFDCAARYFNERDVGKGLKNAMSKGLVKREELFITSKLWCTCMDADVVEESIRRSLSDLQLSYLDLYLIHYPFALKFLAPITILREVFIAPDDDIDLLKPADETGNTLSSTTSTGHYTKTWPAMESLVDKKLTRSIGVSNFNRKQLETILGLEQLKYPPVCMQIEAHPYLQSRKALEFCKSHDIVVVAYSPLAAISVPWRHDAPAVPNDEVLIRIGKQYNKTPTQVALRWGLQTGFCIVPKSFQPSRIRSNFDVFNFTLSATDMEHIRVLDTNQRVHPVLMWKDHPEYPYNNWY